MADTQFEKLCAKLKSITSLQQTPIPYTDFEYAEFVIDGVKALYVDLNKSEAYRDEFDEDIQEFVNKKLLISEEEYILLKAHHRFYETVQADVNNIVGYSTDSLSVTNADKPYANISNEMARIERRLIDLFFKVRLESGS